EREIRLLVHELGAQLISIYGAGTGYCWTTLRKRTTTSGISKISEPKIEFYARSDNASIQEIPTGGNDAWLSLIVSGLDREFVDAGSLKVEIDNRIVTPRYVGRVRPHFENEAQRQLESSIDALTYIEAGIPAMLASGRASVRIRLESGEVSPWF